MPHDHRKINIFSKFFFDCVEDQLRALVVDRTSHLHNRSEPNDQSQVTQWPLKPRPWLKHAADVTQNNFTLQRQKRAACLRMTSTLTRQSHNPIFLKTLSAAWEQQKEAPLFRARSQIAIFFLDWSLGQSTPTHKFVRRRSSKKIQIFTR